MSTSSKNTDDIQKFLETFKDTSGEYPYVVQIDSMMARQSTSITIDYLHISDQLDRLAQNDIDDLLKWFSEAVHQILNQRNPKYAEFIKDDIHVQFFNYPITKSLREIDSNLVGKMITLTGIVLSVSKIQPLPYRLKYVCGNGHVSYSELSSNMEFFPLEACSLEKCDARKLKVDLKGSKYIDFQLVRVQELPEDLPPGQLPRYIDVVALRDLTEKARPGDRVAITGIMRIELDRIIKMGTPIQLYLLRCHANHVDVMVGTNRLGVTAEEMSEQDKERIHALISQPNGYETLSASIAPHITGHEIIKEALFLALIGSDQNILPDGTKIRGDINIFLVGDPGTAKSEMLKFCAKIAPRGLYTSGRGSTAAGLTAAVVKDTTNVFMLEAGAVVLADQGLVCIDEFDKMKPEDRSSLHEAMEQQTVSINKGGILATLNARTAVIAAANPIYGKYDPFKNLTENINIPIPLLTRFDLIFIVRDIPSREKDSIIASHMLRLYSKSKQGMKILLEPEFLIKCIILAKAKKVEFTDEASTKIHEYYLKMRKIDQTENNFTITPRQLSAIIRLASARAKALQKDKVELEDAERAIFLIEKMLENAGVDVNTGQVDLGVLQGYPAQDRVRLSLFTDILKSMQGEQKRPVPQKDLIREMVKSTKWTEVEANNYLREMSGKSIIYYPKPDEVSRI